MTSGCRCSPARSRSGATVSFRTLGCYPLTGAIRRRRPACRDRPRNADVANVRAAGPRDRPRRERIDGAQEGGRLLLMRDHQAPTASRSRRIAARAQDDKPTLRFLTCGSVDDGKSTLIGRLLYDTEADARGPARAGAREQGCTAPRARTSTWPCWSTAWRPSASRASPSTSPIATSRPTSANSSSPTRRATSSTRATWRPAPRRRSRGLLIDARKGVLTQTRRHSLIVSLLGIRHLVLAVNKMDLVGFRRRVRGDRSRYRAFRPARDRRACMHPHVGALRRQCRRREHAMPWYEGRAAGASRDSMSPATCGRRSACRCSGSTGRIRIFAAMRHVATAVQPRDPVGGPAGSAGGSRAS